jgi:hypothetical protein
LKALNAREQKQSLIVQEEKNKDNGHAKELHSEE